MNHPSNNQIAPAESARAIIVPGVDRPWEGPTAGLATNPVPAIDAANYLPVQAGDRPSYSPAGVRMTYSMSISGEKIPKAGQ